MREWSPRCCAYLDHYEEKMILAPEDLAFTRARLESEKAVPCVDPLIRKNIYQLALSGWLGRGCCRV